MGESEMKEYYETLTDVKVSLAEINGKVDSLTDIRTDVKEAINIAKDAYATSKTNTDDIKEIKTNDSKKWAAIFTVGGAFVLQILYFLMTYGIK